MHVRCIGVSRTRKQSPSQMDLPHRSFFHILLNALSGYRFLFYFISNYVGVGTYIYMSADDCGEQKVSESLEPELQIIVSCSKFVRGAN